MSDQPARKPDVQTLLKLKVPVIVQLGRRTMPVERVLSLGPGTILELPRAADTPLDLMINNKRIGQGTAVKVGENFGLSILSIGDVVERIEAMGDDPPDIVEAFPTSASPPAEQPAPDPNADAPADAEAPTETQASAERAAENASAETEA
ncbi:MAG: hypothetical protein CMJ49_10290 [Planctomycetaceae bacterium]|nr:hypothetical protein [Planctomycetaceae bacterium]